MCVRVRLRLCVSVREYKSVFVCVNCVYAYVLSVLLYVCSTNVIFFYRSFQSSLLS